MTDDFDFDFDVNAERSSAGTRTVRKDERSSEREGAGEPPGPNGGAADDPFANLDFDVSDEQHDAANGRSERPPRSGRARNGRTGATRASNGRSGNRGRLTAFQRGREALRRAGRLIEGEEIEPKDGGDPNGAGSEVETPRRPRRELPPLIRRDRQQRPPERESVSEDGGEDWLSLADDDLGRADLDSISDPAADPPGPSAPAEGRALARDARRRATRRPDRAFGDGATADDSAEQSRPAHAGDGGEDFESLLEQQPQKSELGKRSSAVVHGLRGLLDEGRERLRGGAEVLRGGGDRLSALRENLPSTVRSRPSEDGAPPPPRLPKRLGSRRPRKPEPGRIKKLRLGVILVGVGVLAMVSTVFGMMMAVAGDLPQLENEAQYRAARNSEVFDAEGRKLGTLLSNTQRRLVESEDISPYMKQAAVAVEDERFYEHRGVDFMGIARAVYADVLPGGSTQGASTITMQFVKNALEAQGSRTVFQKLREAALAYHLERQWDKDKILTQYLNSIYFGEGAYGIEMAARTYFGKQHPECLAEGADPCASELAPEEAAMLAGIISAPGAFSPRANPEAALSRRNLVLTKMTEQGVLTQEELEEATTKALPAASDIEKPEEDSLSPYFTSWLRQQVVDRYGAGKAFAGGLDVHTTIDLDMQETAEQIAYDRLAGIEPTASVVVLDKDTGAVKALVGGNDFEEEPFNLATNGQRQPGSAFKPFVLAAYLKEGGSPYDTFTSAEKDWIVPNSAGKERFHVENYEDNYLGSADVATATKYSDNSVFTEMGLGPPPGSKQGVLGGIRRGPRTIAALAEDMGIRTQVDRIPAITLGAPSIGFTPLEMTYAFNTIATEGERVGSNLDSCLGNRSLDELCPTGITKIVGPDGDVQEKFEPKSQRVLPESVGGSVKSLLHGPVSSGGTGQDAQTPGDEWGKTGTTENHGDAWFCGGTDHLTACVWVGHAMNNTPMETEYAGEPVAGGTYPAQIWGSIMTELEQIYEARLAERESESDEDDDSDSSSSYGGSSSGSSSSSSSSGGGSTGGGGGAGQATQTPAPAPSGGGATGTGGTGL